MCLEQLYLLSAVLAMIGALCQSQARGIHIVIGQTSLMIIDSISLKLRKWPAPVAVRRNHIACAVAVHSGFCLPGATADPFRATALPPRSLISQWQIYSHICMSWHNQDDEQ